MSFKKTKLKSIFLCCWQAHVSIFKLIKLQHLATEMWSYKIWKKHFGDCERSLTEWWRSPVNSMRLHTRWSQRMRISVTSLLARPLKMGIVSLQFNIVISENVLCKARILTEWSHEKIKISHGFWTQTCRLKRIINKNSNKLC